MQVKHLAKLTSKFLSDRSSVILTGLAVAGVVSTTTLAIQGTIKAIREIDREPEYLTPLVAFKKTWQYYLPAIVTGSLTIAAIISSQAINQRRQAAVMSAFTISEGAFRDYRDKAIELLGEKKERAIQDEVMKDKIDRRPVSDSQVIVTGNGDSLCFDAYSGRYFHSDIERIRRAINDFNATLISNSYGSLNEFYHMLNLEPTTAGNDLGWTSDKLLDVSFSSHLSSDGKPCLALQYNTKPLSNYYKVY